MAPERIVGRGVPSMLRVDPAARGGAAFRTRPRRSGGRLVPYFHPLFEPRLSVVTILFVVYAFLNPDLDPHVTVFDLFPEFEFRAVIVKTLLDSDLDTGIMIIIMVLVTACLRTAGQAGSQRQSRNCCDPEGSHEFWHLDHFLELKSRAPGRVPEAARELPANVKLRQQNVPDTALSLCRKLLGKK